MIRTVQHEAMPPVVTTILLAIFVISVLMCLRSLGHLWSLSYGERARKFDLDCAWPIYRLSAGNLALARLCFLEYLATRPAWRRMRANWTKDTLDEFVRANLN